MSNIRFSRNDNFPPVVKNLIIINVLVWVAQLVFENQYQLSSRIAMWPVGSEAFRPYQVFTHMFAHATYDSRGSIIFSHILFNMFALWVFGRVLENVWGAKRFLLFYLACGIGAAIAHEAVAFFQYRELLDYINYLNATGNTELALEYGSRMANVVGASGAIMGVMVGFAMLFPNTELFIMFIPVPVKAKWVVLVYVLLDLFGGLYPTGDGIAHFAHLGGAVTGFIIVWIWNKTNRRTLY